MFKFALFAAATALLFSAANAEATPISLTFTGQISAYGMYDGSQQFGPNSYGGNLNPLNYSIAISYDPATLTADSCPTGSVNNSCQWNFGASGVSEAITINGITKTYTATSGNIQFCACTTDAIYITASSNGVEFGGSFVDSTSLFSSQTNENAPNLLVAFSDVSLSSANFQSSTSVGGNLSFSTTPKFLSDSLPATPVPEPFTLSIFGAGLAGAAALRRRKKSQKA
jgi:hypothetical protein